jgi:hypothetical protein
MASYFDRLAKSLRSPKKTTPIGSRTEGKEYTALPKEAAMLVGFAVKKGDWFGSTIIASFQPIYATLKGTVRGPTVGRPADEFPIVVEAKPGYVVSELLVSAPQSHLHGIKVVFRKIDFLRQGVIASDTYESDWIGVELDGESVRVGDATRPAVGLTGRADKWIASIGLIHAS